ncbi:MAG: CusA/CzcA family heavy metal efflux RND transporter [Ignavibacteria bacterium]|nr:CusA/CzcA family heavy metal efflux RND transporter [Ignavibacteria bacterium]
MLEKIISATLRYRNYAVIFSLLIIIAGIIVYQKLPIDAFPDVTNVQVEIVSKAPGLSALEIEKFVTFPVEYSMRGLPDLTQMRSVTKFGLSVITLVFKDNVDIYFARNLVFQRLQEAKQKTPEGVEIEMGPVATAMGEIYQFTLEGKIPDDENGKLQYLTNLRTMQEWIITPLLKTVPGVNEINSFGGYFKQYQVITSPDKLIKYNLTVEDVFDAIQRNNKNAGGNILNKNSSQIIIRGVGLLKTEGDLKNITLKSFNGIPVFIKDVAEVKIGEAVRQGASMMNGKEEAVGGIVMMLKGENGREAVKKVKEKVEEINSSNVLPKGLKIVPYYDRSDIVNSSVRTVSKALIEGAVFVIIILYLMLRNFRGSAIVISALAMAIFLTFVVMKLIGLDANLMSLGGLAISIGMIIDATIIQVENVQRHLSESKKGGNKLSTVLKSVIEVRKPSILGELIIAVTFLPIISLEGLEGKMFTPLALTVAIALLSSLMLSIFIIPALSSIILKPGKEKESIIMKYAKKIYLPVLNWSLKRKYAVLSIAIILFCFTIYLVPKLGTEFIPVMDEGAFDMDVQLLPEVSLDKSLEINKQVAQILMKFPELKMVISRTGQTGVSVEARGIDKTGFTGIFLPRDQWKTAKDNEEMVNMMRDSLSSIPGIVFSFSQPIQCRIDELVAGTKSQLIIKLFGEDINLLKEKANDISKLVSGIRGATDVVVERVAGQPYLSINVDRDKISRYGLNVNDVLKVIEIAIGGMPATQLYEENKSFDVVVRFPEEYRNSVDKVGNILVPTAHGYNVPLNQLADISISKGPVQISRQDGQRRIGIEMNVKDRDIGSFVSEAQEKIRKKINLPAGYYTSWGGQFENQQRAMAKLLIILPVSILIILSLLFLTFKSLKLALLVIFNLPFALIGGVFALFISGMYLSVPASVGFIVLFGVAVLNGVVIVSYISQLRQDGMELKEAIIKGSNDRLRPVLMTASIAIFSLIPMLYATGPGSEIQRPLAVVVVGGLFTSTFLTLVLIPTIYSWFEKRDIENEL